MAERDNFNEQMLYQAAREPFLRLLARQQMTQYSDELSDAAQTAYKLAAQYYDVDPLALEEVTKQGVLRAVVGVDG